MGEINFSMKVSFLFKIYPEKTKLYILYQMINLKTPNIYQVEMTNIEIIYEGSPFFNIRKTKPIKHLFLTSMIIFNMAKS